MVNKTTKTNHHLNKILLNFILFILIISSLIFLVQSLLVNKETRTKAARTSRLLFEPASSTTAPINTMVGDSIPLKIVIDPGQALVSYIRFEINYDPGKLVLDNLNPVVINSTSMQDYLEGPIYSPGKISASLNIGQDPAKAIGTKQTIATINFKTLTSSTQPTVVSYGSSCLILSIAPGDQASENTLVSTEPAYIIIKTDGQDPTITPPSTLSPTNTISTTPISQIPTKIPVYPVDCPYAIPDAALPMSVTKVGSEVWITNYDNDTITRMTSLGKKISEPIKKNGLDGPVAMALIDNEVWVTNYDNSSISFFNLDGTPGASASAIPKADGLTKDGALGITKIGEEVWITDQKNDVIYHYGADKKYLGSFNVPGIEAMRLLTTVGNEVWIVSNPTMDPNNADGKIYRLDISNKVIGDPISDNSLINPTHIAVVDDEVWVTEDLDKRISRFTKNGDLIANFSLDNSAYVINGLGVIKDQVWVIEAVTDSVYVYDLSAHPLCYFQPSPTPKPTLNPNRITLSANLLLNGIGAAGDSTNPNATMSNKSPLHQERTMSIQVVNSDNEVVANKIASVFYNSDGGNFFSNVVLNDNLIEDDYIIKIKAGGYLRKLMPGFFTLAPGKKITLPQTRLVTGDINDDNALNILDYNILYDCGYGAINPLSMVAPGSSYSSKACKSHPSRALADLNDNGIIEETDYNLFTREIHVQRGE